MGYNDRHKGQFFVLFGSLYDIRQEGKVWHKLNDILFILYLLKLLYLEDRIVTIDTIGFWRKIVKENVIILQGNQETLLGEVKSYF